MRTWSLISLLLVCAGCTVRVPRGLGVTVSVKATSHVEARIPPPEPVVPLEGAAVVEFFGIPLDGVQDVVFVLDCSGSMAELAQGPIAQLRVPSSPPAVGAGSTDGPRANDGSLDTQPRKPRKIDIAQAELVDALERLPAGTRMNVLFFNSDLEAFAPSMVPLEETSRAGLIGFVKATAPTGSTALAPAMRTTFLMDARRIVLLSDGLGNVGGNAQAVLRDAREAMGGGVRIDTIGLGKGQDAELLQALASESGGLYQAL